MAKLKVGDYVAGWFRPIKIRAGNTKYLGPTDEELELTAYQIAKDNLELRTYAERYKWTREEANAFTTSGLQPSAFQVY